mmetsp:Transcript_19685/g.42789  ORF Transcript_19685/g.42789 Transcript_19685/m.42789 type:complete len:93 (-) Transcript_19685:451-729(-)
MLEFLSSSLSGHQGSILQVLVTASTTVLSHARLPAYMPACMHACVWYVSMSVCVCVCVCVQRMPRSCTRPKLSWTPVQGVVEHLMPHRPATI